MNALICWAKCFGFVSPPIREPLSFDAFECNVGASVIVDAEGLTV
jgi:hypothetical protein